MRFLLVALISQLAHAAPVCTETGPDRPGTAESIAFSRDGRSIATTAKAETRVGRWRFDGAAGKLLADKTYSTPVDSVTLLGVSADAQFAIGSDLDQNLVLHDLEKTIPGKVFKDGLTNPDQSGVISSQVVMTPDARWILSSHENGQILLWDTTSPSGPAATMNQKEPGALAISMTNDNVRRALVASGDEHGLFLWNLKDPAKPERVTLFNRQPTMIEDVAIAADGKTAAVRDSNGTVQVWNLDAPKLTATLKWKPPGKGQPPALGVGFPQVDRVGEGRLAISPDGGQIAIVDPGSKITLWDVTKPDKQVRLDQPPIARSVAFSADGNWLAAGGVGTFCVHRAKTPVIANAAPPEKGERRKPKSPDSH